MADSKRLRTLKLLTTWLEQEVAIANGYRHDLADAVFRGRAYLTDADPLPCVSLLESPTPDRDRRRAGTNDNAGEGTARGDWVLLLQGWVKEDFRFPCDAAYELMADVKKAIAKLYVQSTADARLVIAMGDGDTPLAYYIAGLTSGMVLEGGTVRPPEHSSEKAFFWMRVILKFTEKVNDPFSYT